VGRNLFIEACTNLVYLPENLNIVAFFGIENCPKLISLPNGLRVEGNLKIYPDINITELPENLFVGGNLDLSECENLRSLPEGLRVGGDLDVSDCENLSSLPENIRIGGDLTFEDCYKLRSLPESFLNLGLKANGEMRRVNLGDTGLDEDFVERLREGVFHGMRFYLPEPSIFIPGTQMFRNTAPLILRPEMRRHLETLGIAHVQEPTITKITKAYHKLSLIHHPDKPTGNAEKFTQINDAYEALKAELSKKNNSHPFSNF